MEIFYKKLWKLLIDNGLRKIDLLEKANISTSTLAKFVKNEYVSMEALVKVCAALNVNIGDIVDLAKEDN